MAKKSLDLIQAMHAIAADAQPITGRGIGYKLFTVALIPSMATSEMAKVYRLLTQGRERGLIPWDWIVDETRKLERDSSWDDPEEFAGAVIRDYRRDYWTQQPVRVEVWSEKGTIRGVLGPVLDEYGVGYRVMHGFGSATAVYEVARYDDGRPLIVLYVGDWDPSGLCMSERDLPERLSRYGGKHVVIKRIALTKADTAALSSSSFKATSKKDDPRYNWFVDNFGTRCWELDAMDPNDLRDRVEEEILSLIEPTAWERCKVTERAERESLTAIIGAWGRGAEAMGQ